MTEKTAWRAFQQMQSIVLAVGLLVYAAAAVDAWQALPGHADFKWRLTVIFPAVYTVVTLACVLAVPALRRAIRRHLWASYRTGFGQTVISVLGGLGVLIAIAGLIVWQVHHVAGGGTSPSGAFSGYGAGLGLLLAQVILIRGVPVEPDGEPVAPS